MTGRGSGDAPPGADDPPARVRDLAAGTRGVYERNAARFDAERRRVLIERPWLERFAAAAAPGAPLLDFGCGTGDPIARYFLEQGFAVTGADIAAPMLALARERFPTARFPGARWVEADMRAPNLAAALGAGAFGGLVAWHSFFHLTPEEQRAALPHMAALLAPGAPMMLTVGPEAGEVTGRVGDETVYHASLSLAAYAAVLDHAGLSVRAFIAEDSACGGSTILLAQKR